MISSIVFVNLTFKRLPESSALSNGHITDIKMVEQLVEQLVEGLQVKLYVDRGYIS